MTKVNRSFQNFLQRFPIVDLPVILAEDTHHVFSNNNEPLSEKMIIEFLSVPLDDEYTEVVPCFRVPNTHDFHAVIYWKAALMDYQYVMTTFHRDGTLIAKKALTHTYIKNDTLTRSVATIEEDWLIYVVEGQSNSDDQMGLEKSTAKNLELLADGSIITLKFKQ